MDNFYKGREYLRERKESRLVAKILSVAGNLVVMAIVFYFGYMILTYF